MEQQDASAAPTAGGGGETSAPSQTYDSSIGDRELGISPEDRKDINDHGEFIMSFQPLVFPGHGIIASAPLVLQIVKQYPDRSADVKVMYTLSNREKLQNADGSKFNGQVEDKPAHMSRQELDRVRLDPFSKGAMGGQMGGPMQPPGGPGGMPPGMPPGSPPGGGMPTAMPPGSPGGF